MQEIFEQGDKLGYCSSSASIVMSVHFTLKLLLGTVTSYTFSYIIEAGQINDLFRTEVIEIRKTNKY